VEGGRRRRRRRRRKRRIRLSKLLKDVYCRGGCDQIGRESQY
jgi:hypothetical protein